MRTAHYLDGMVFPSPIQTITLDNHTFYLKRDDLIHPDFSGNKARKFYYFLTHDFPNIDTLISYGSAQSNAMYSLSVLAKMRGWRFEYYVDHIASYLQEYPSGNFKGAMENHTIFKVASDIPTEQAKSTLMVEEGGRQKEAEYGIAILAQEIVAWQEKSGIEKLNIFLPSGTGTTALFLQKSLLSLDSSCVTQVYTTPCVGDTAYLKKQFLMLEAQERYHPTILSLSKKHHFGKLYRENYRMWLKLKEETDVEFDLLYDPLGWRTLLYFSELYTITPLLYIHQGGVLGNESMRLRYERKFGDLTQI